MKDEIIPSGMRILPRDEECEKRVLGTILSERDTIYEVRDILTENCFYNDFHKQIYRTVLEITDSGGRADAVSVKSKLEFSYPDFSLYELVKISGMYTFDLYQYACRLHDLMIRRRFFDIGSYLDSNAFNEKEDIADVVQKVSDQLANLFSSNCNSISTVKESIESVYETINRNMSGKTELTGTPTGFDKIDGKTGGLQKSDLIIIAGETSQGKTSLAVSMMKNAAIAGAKIAMYSMEMKKEQITSRIISMISGIPSNVILYSPLSGMQLENVDRAVDTVSKMQIYFDDRSTSNIDTIISSIRQMKLKNGIDGAVVDYLQILNVNMKGSNKEQQLGEAARRLKNLAKDLDIWIIALSQMNRDNLNPVPTLARLRDSGQIAEAADIVMLIYRPEVKGKRYPDEFSDVDTKGTAMIDIAKGRNIGLLKFICGFNAASTHFYDLNIIPISSNSTEEDNNPF